MSYYTLSVSLLVHNSSVCLLKNHEVELFYQNERINRIKNSSILDLKELEPVIKKYKNIDLLVLTYFTDEQVVSFTEFLKNQNVKFGKIVRSNEHHLFHAYSGYYLSGMQDAVCVVMDGLGSDFFENGIQFNESTSIIRIKNLQYTNLYKKYITNPLQRNQPKVSQHDITNVSKKLCDLCLCPVEVEDNFDAGFMYGYFTVFVGFNKTEEGKLMGLSSYGEYNKKFDKLLTKDLYKGLTVNKKILSEKKGWSYVKEFKNYSELKFTTFKESADLSFSAQKAFESLTKEKMMLATKLCDSNNFVLSGGCALNVINNSKLKQEFKNLSIFVDPIANDATISLGSAVYFYSREINSNNFIHQKASSLSFGPKYSNQEIFETIENFNNENSTNN